MDAPDEATSRGEPDEATTGLGQVRASARGWHEAQLAVLGFIGLCGVLQGSSGAQNPGWLQVVAGVLVLTALVLACAATGLVAGVAWPIYGAAAVEHAPSGDATMVRHTASRLRAGIALTYLAVVVLAVAATSSWWPKDTAASLLEVTTDSGSFCGRSLEGAQGTVALDAAGQRLDIAVAQIRGVRAVGSCP